MVEDKNVFIKVPAVKHQKMKFIALLRGDKTMNKVYLEAVENYLSGKEEFIKQGLSEGKTTPTLE